MLIPAAIFHDCMKVRDYDENGKGTDYKDKIYHVAGSYAVWFAEASGMFPYDFVDAVGHCILAHHGRREWKSCNEPKTVEALILHQSDMLSARYGKNMNKSE